MNQNNVKPILIHITGKPALIPFDTADIPIHSKPGVVTYQKKIQQAMLDAGAVRLKCLVEIEITYQAPEPAAGWLAAVLRTVRIALSGTVLEDGSQIRQSDVVYHKGDYLLEIRLVPLTEIVPLTENKQKNTIDESFEKSESRRRAKWIRESQVFRAYTPRSSFGKH